MSQKNYAPFSVKINEKGSKSPCAWYAGKLDEVFRVIPSSQWKNVLEVIEGPHRNMIILKKECTPVVNEAVPAT